MPDNKTISRWLTIRPLPEPKFVPSGIYHYTHDEKGTYTRFHLRVDPDGQGYLLVNATVAARLSPPGAVIAKGLLDGIKVAEIKATIRRSFKGVTEVKLDSDINQLSSIITNLEAPGDNYPVINLDDAALSSRASRLMAPMRADIEAASFAAIRTVLERLWDVGLPHVTFVFGQGVRAEDLIKSVKKAEDLGMIAGVRGRASDLGSMGVAENLASAGADYVSLFHASADQHIHDSLLGDGDHATIEPLFDRLLDLEVPRVADIPLLPLTTTTLGDTLFALMGIGVSNVNFFAIALPDDDGAPSNSDALYASALPQIADLVEEWASESEVRFVWQPPLLRNPAIPLSEQVRHGPRCSDDLSVRINHSGEVVPARGPYLSAGNILRDDWDSIWNNQAFRRYRERVEMPTRCEVCPGLAICAADCPRELSGWSQPAGDSS